MGIRGSLCLAVICFFLCTARQRERLPFVSSVFNPADSKEKDSAGLKTETQTVTPEGTNPWSCLYVDCFLPSVDIEVSLVFNFHFLVLSVY